MRLPPFARRSTMGTTDRSKKRSRRCAARPRSDEITTRLSCSFNFLAIRGLMALQSPIERTPSAPTVAAAQKERLAKPTKQTIVDDKKPQPNQKHKMVQKT